MPAPHQENKSVAGAAFMAAAAFAIALILTILFASREQPSRPANQGVAPQAQVTPDTTGAGPEQGTAR